ncbi:unnamed protein product [Eruca vesicaria subsp. sativa]|uniref:Myb-like domain-containing protein n=1 Tax=Eruca vesicaria subsp. sativa TaxID=29727 RepID=A0ABC8IPI0_ERUVS|nr:unnamed protein product [Eruca vesicaria subsp. sativa]
MNRLYKFSSPTFFFSCIQQLNIKYNLPSSYYLMDNTDRRRCCKQHKATLQDSEEVSSTDWEFINMSAQEEDLIFRMYRLVGDRWDLIAGRVPGRQPEEIERFWIMRSSDSFAEKRRQLHQSFSHKNNKLHRPLPSIYPS